MFEQLGMRSSMQVESITDSHGNTPKKHGTGLRISPNYIGNVTQMYSFATGFLVEIVDHFAELLVADLAVAIFVHHPDEFVNLPAS
jgi:hypothetical protein